MYDITGGWRIGERHSEVDKDEALAHLPTLTTDHLVAGFLYFDARADDARLTPHRRRGRRPSSTAPPSPTTPRSSASRPGRDGAVERCHRPPGRR